MSIDEYMQAALNSPVPVNWQEVAITVYKAGVQQAADHQKQLAELKPKDPESIPTNGD